MKKIIFLLTSLYVLTACHEDYKDWIMPASSQPQSDLKIDAQVAAAEPVDMTQTLGDSVQLFKPMTQTAESAETYKPMLCNGDKSQKISITCDNKGKVSTTDLRNAVMRLYGRSPKTHNVPIVVEVYKDFQGHGFKLLRDTHISITLPRPVIEKAYYYIGTLNGWSTTDKTYALTNGGKDPYLNPIFTVLLPVAKNDKGENVENWFKIAPASAYAAQDFWAGQIIGAETNGDGKAKGFFVTAAQAQAWCLPAKAGAKHIRLTFDMMEGSWDFSYVD